MTKLTRAFLPAVLFVVFSAVGHAQVNCTAAATPNTIRTEGITELIADIVITCTGGTPVVNGGDVPFVDLVLNIDAPITSKPINIQGEFFGIPTEAYLLVDEPAPSSQLWCDASMGSCPVQGTGNGVGTYSGSGGRSNMFTGELIGQGQLDFYFPFDPPGAGTRVLRFTNVRVAVPASATEVHFGFSSMDLSIGALDITASTVDKGANVVAQNAVPSLAGITSFDVVLSEGFAKSWKTRTAAAFADNDTSPAPVDQNQPGTVYNSESGFYNSTILDAGLADSGSRLVVSIAVNDPGITLSAPLVVNLRNAANVVTGVARRIDVGFDGSGIFAPSSSLEMVQDRGIAWAVYEVLSDDPTALETARIPVTVSYASAPFTNYYTGFAGLAPVFLMDPIVPQFQTLDPFFAYADAQIITSSIPVGIQGQAYQTTFQALGGSPPYTFSILGLPQGLSMTSDGVIQGTPVQNGLFSLAVTVKDVEMGSSTKYFDLLIASPLTLITPTPLPDATAESPYQISIDASGGYGARSFSLVSGGVPGMQLQSNGTLVGTSPQPGTYSLTVQVTDALGQTASGVYSLKVVGLPPALAPSIVTMNFNTVQGGGPPPAQSLALVAPDQANATFAITVNGNNASPSWLFISLEEGAIPARLTVSVNPTGLTPGTYNAKINIVQSNDISAAPIQIDISLSVQSLAPKLGVTPDTLEFSAVRPLPGTQTRTVSLANLGGGTVTYSASITANSPWIKLTGGSSGQATQNQAGSLNVQVDSTGLATGQYRDTLHVQSDAGNFDLPVALFVTEGGAVMDLGVDGVTFQTRSGSGTATTQEVSVVNRGDTGSTLHWTAQKVDASDTWFTINNVAGASTTLQPSKFSVALTQNAGQLTPGSYYSLVKVSDPAAAGSPRFLLVVLNVSAANTIDTLDLETSGVVFLARPFAATPRTANIRFSSSSTSSVSFQAAAATNNTGNWLSVTPASGFVSAGSYSQIAITADSSSLAAGVYRGEVVLARGTVVRAVNITFIVADSSVTQSAPARSADSAIRAAACVPGQLVATSTEMPNNYQVPAGWPETLAVELRNNCGDTVAGASVIASFSNGDAPLSLKPDGTPGVYSATWEPGTALKNVNITIRTTATGLEPSTPLLIGEVTANVVPKLVPNGTLHGLFPQVLGALTPGVVVQIYGENLATVTEATNTVPLPTTYKGTHVLIGGYDAPLYYVSPTVVVAELPSEIAPNQSVSVVVEVDNAITVPDHIDLVSAKPGIATFSDGRLIAQHADYTLVDATHPAKPGEILTMYLVGLGPTNPAVASGALSPGSAPLAQPVTQPTVTVDGQPAQVAFAGLTPFAIALGQINFFVPASARTGVPLNVVVKQGNETSNVATLTLVP